MISEEEFNRRVMERNSANPEDDSRGDSAVNSHLEIDLGKRGSEISLSTLKEIEEEDEGHIKAASSPDQEKIEDDINNEAHKGSSSSWPDAGEISSG